MALALPDGPRGRAMALGLTFAVMGLIWLGIVQPVIDSYGEGADTLERRTALAQRMGDVADSLPLLQSQAKASAAVGPPVNATLDGNTDSLAGANLQSLVEGMASAAGAHLTSTEALPAEAVGDYRRIALRVSVDATWAVLIRLLQAVEHATPHMFIDDLQLHAQPTAARTRELPLDISFTVLAFRPTVVSEPAPHAQAGDESAPSPSGSDQTGPRPSNRAAPPHPTAGDTASPGMAKPGALASDAGPPTGQPDEATATQPAGPPPGPTPGGTPP